MAKAIVFEQANTILGRPKGMTKEECRVLPLWTDGNTCVSCWKLTQEERATVAETGRVYVVVMSGASTQPPVALWGSDPFESSEPETCDKCQVPHPTGAFVVTCSKCFAEFQVDGCVLNADCGLGAFTCPTCDDEQNEMSDENW